jgi:hypothetical protein
VRSLSDLFAGDFCVLYQIYLLVMLRTLSDLFDGYLCVRYQINLLVIVRMLSDVFAGYLLRMLIHVLLYYTNTNTTHDTLILLMIH